MRTSEDPGLRFLADRNPGREKATWAFVTTLGESLLQSLLATNRSLLVVFSIPAAENVGLVHRHPRKYMS
jgi:hypothetical protein